MMRDIAGVEMPEYFGKLMSDKATAGDGDLTPNLPFDGQADIEEEPVASTPKNGAGKDDEPNVPASLR